jgi:hypothetical protein
MRILLSFSGVATILPTTAIPHGAVIVVIGLIVGGAILGHQIWTSRHAITAEDSNIKTE